MPVFCEPLQAFNGRRPQDFGVFGAVDHLQVLDGEFDIADRAGAKLDLAPFDAVLLQLFLGHAAKFIHSLAFGIRLAGGDHRPGAIEQDLPGGRVPGNDARLE